MDEIRKAVRESYGQIASRGGSCCAPSCCTPDAAPPAAETSKRLGYSDEDVSGVPEGANLGLGCGNPRAIAALRPGETVLDLGSGAGFDCFLAAKQVGADGHVIGVDMTAEMVSLARENAATAGVSNVEFRLGEIEHLPVADASVDVILSNCVINLSPDKPSVFREAFRVLRPGGRLAISDVVATAPLPESLRNDLRAIAGCVGGAATIAELEAILTEVGFADVRVAPVDESKEIIREWAPQRGLDQYIISATIEAIRK
jgi:SAM-dependent methyltransferase